MCPCRRTGVDDRIRRLGWLAVWLVARYGLRVWLIGSSSPADTALNRGVFSAQETP